jgi:hypothetical protein
VPFDAIKHSPLVVLFTFILDSAVKFKNPEISLLISGITHFSPKTNPGVIPVKYIFEPDPIDKYNLSASSFVK